MTYREPTQILIYCYKIINDQQMWLLLKRSPSRGSFWQGITGAIEPGEKLLQAALREMMEETALKPLNILQTELKYTITVRPEWASKYNYDPAVKQLIEYVFVAQLADNATPILSEEHTEYCWKKACDAIPMFKWPKNAEALDIISRKYNLTE